ncbi:MAG: TonB-dependent receptor, partial [Acidobacteriota bacterium]
LDTPEFRPVHAAGNTGTGFDRMDFQPTGKDTFHLNLMLARNWFQVPNTYAQEGQDQRQKVVSFNIAPGYQHAFDARRAATVNMFFRRDIVDYYPSRNALDDSPATVSQSRSLTNFGIRADLLGTQGRHTWKTGATLANTHLAEEFRLGLTDPSYNAACLRDGVPAPSPEPREPALCAGEGLEANPEFLGSLLAYDLSRGGQPYQFRGRANIAQFSFFGQDALTLGALTLHLGVRYDRYNGLTHGDSVQPRGAFAWLLKRTGTVVRGGYSHTMETPTNENLVVSSSTGAGGLAGNVFQGTAEQRPLALGSRNQYDAGIQQRLGGRVTVDVNYFRKYTRNAFDFDALFSTPVTFPIGWRQSKLDGISARINTAEMRGFRVDATMGHANARFFGPENGGIVFNSNLTVGAYRQDHDQVYQQNVNIRYQKNRDGWWTNFTWRYDSGLVVGAVNNLNDALALTADQQTIIGLYCGSEQASLSHRIVSCQLPDSGARRIHILAPGAENDDHNPPRTTSRHILNIGVGTDNLFHREHIHTVLRLTVVNLTNQAALYNFLSPFGGTHWVEPRRYQAQVGWAF